MDTLENQEHIQKGLNTACGKYSTKASKQKNDWVVVEVMPFKQASGFISHFHTLTVFCNLDYNLLLTLLGTMFHLAKFNQA